MTTIKELRELLDNATPGPWNYDGPPNNKIVWSGPEQRVCFLTSDGPTEANASLIAASHNTLPALLDLIEEMAGALKHARHQFPYERYGLDVCLDIKEALAAYEKMKGE